MFRPMYLFCSISIIFLFVACSQDSKKKEAVAAPKDISSSFSIVAVDPVEEKEETDKKNAKGVADLAIDNERISIDESALEKEFLLRAQMIQQLPVPMFTGMKSRVVAFKKRSGKVYMLEATKGHTVSHDVPQNLVLAEFPILDEKDGKITFDFNAGMSSLFVAKDWRASDFSEEYGEFTSLKKKSSFIEEAKLDKNRLVIRQVALLVSSSANGEVNVPIEAKYYISPYQPDSTYQKVKAPRTFDHMGFFEVASYLTEKSTSERYATRFHPDKPIVFAISANTPERYKNAVKEGILYWANILGEGKVQAIEAPEGVSAPDIDYNVVQWAEWDTAGFAYADAQMDPRTGEILNAQVLFTSAFAMMEIRANRILRKAEGTKKIALRGFEPSHLCNRHADESFFKAAAKLKATSTPEQQLKISQDYVRVIVAHEIGHTLGLRHNFAGSLATNFPLSKRAEHVKNYLKTGVAAKELVTSSSVMEYQATEEWTMTGNQIVHHGKVLDYDKMAIEKLYLGKEPDKENRPLFCTDSHAGKLIDCTRGDTGASVVEYYQWALQESLEGLPFSILENYIAAKAPGIEEAPLAVEEVGFDPNQIASSILYPRVALVHLLTGQRHLQIERRYPVVSPLLKDEIEEEVRVYVASELEKLGGLSEVLADFDEDFVAKGYEKLASLLNGSFKSGQGNNGKAYKFTSGEIEIIKATAKKLFEKVGEELVKENLKLLKGKEEELEKKVLLKDNAVSNEFADILASYISKYVLSESGQVLEAEILVPDTEKIDEMDAKELLKKEKAETLKKKVSVKLPVFAQEHKIRLSAASLLMAGRSEAPEWGIHKKAELFKKLEERIKSSLGGASIDEVKPEEASAEAARWVLQNKAILEALKK